MAGRSGIWWPSECGANLLFWHQRPGTLDIPAIIGLPEQLAIKGHSCLQIGSRRPLMASISGISGFWCHRARVADLWLSTYWGLQTYAGRHVEDHSHMLAMQIGSHRLLVAFQGLCSPICQTPLLPILNRYFMFKKMMRFLLVIKKKRFSSLKKIVVSSRIFTFFTCSPILIRFFLC